MTAPKAHFLAAEIGNWLLFDKDLNSLNAKVVII